MAHIHEVVYNLVHWFDDKIFRLYPTFESCVGAGVFPRPKLEEFFGSSDKCGKNPPGHANYTQCAERGIGRRVIAKMLEGTENSEAIKQALSNLLMTERQQRRGCKISQVRQLREVLISLVCNHAILIVRLRYCHYPVATSAATTLAALPLIRLKAGRELEPMFDWNNLVLVVFTDLGDSAVLGAVVVVVAAYLWIARCRRTALVLAGALVAGAVGIGLLKTAFLGCEMYVGKLTIRSPSGHAGLSCAVLGTLASVMAGQLAGWRRLLPYVALVPLIGTITATRVLLNYHNVNEALVGLLMGGAVAALAHVVLRRGPEPVFNRRGLVLVVTAVSILLNGVRLPAEECIHLLAATVREHVSICRVSMLPDLTPSSQRVAASELAGFSRVARGRGVNRSPSA